LEEDEKLNGVFKGEKQRTPPIWIMRQAGRYLPEYLELREKAGSFWNLCMTPEYAAEATMQPVRRFGFDAAIVFSDILIIPAALGYRVDYSGNGPTLQSPSSGNTPEADEDVLNQNFSPVYKTIQIVRGKLNKTTGLIGFAGAPWTLASYMAAGGGGDERKTAKLWAYRDEADFTRLIDLLTDCVSRHLIGQLKAGADAVQLFDSWAGGLAEPLFLRFVIEPARAIVARVKAEIPGAKIIGFPRDATLDGYRRYAQTGVDAISLDTAIPALWAAKNLPNVVLQGNLDPLALVAGGKALEDGVIRILEAMRGRANIFNLGHGILPETPIPHVEKLIALVRSFS
jgi:uroporphyrinogen decarboxylase